MKLDVGFATTTEVPELIAHAESLGYGRAWCFNSPAVYADPWMMLALAGERTERIELGVMVIPDLRHVVDYGAAIATLATLAGRPISLGVGAGYASRVLLGQRAVSWKRIETFIIQLRALLAGEEVEVDGALVKLLQGPGSGVKIPVDVRLFVAGHGPKGREVAERVGDGVIAEGPIEWDSSSRERLTSLWGTVLEEGEADDSERAFEAAGPAAAFILHLGGVGSLVDSEEVAGFQRAVEAFPESQRHLKIHGAHFIGMTELDREFVTPRVIREATDTGDAALIRARLEELEAQGVTTAIYVPTGPDRKRELSAMAEAAEIG